MRAAKVLSPSYSFVLYFAGGGDDGSSKVKEEEVDTAWSARKEEGKENIVGEKDDKVVWLVFGKVLDRVRV